MPKTGDRNDQFGVFKSNCCGSEIVIGPGMVFPTCPAHPGATAWVTIRAENDSATTDSKVA